MNRRSTVLLTPVALTQLMSACTRPPAGDHETPYLMASLVNAMPENGMHETVSAFREEAIPVQASARPNISPPNWNHYDLLTSRLNPRDQVAHGSTGCIAYVDGCFAHRNLTSNNLITGAYREPSGEYRYPYYTYSYLDSQTSRKVPALAGSKGPDGNHDWYMVHLGRFVFSGLSYVLIMNLIK